MDHLDTIKPLLKISQWTGLAPFYVHVNPLCLKKELYISKDNYINTVIVLLTLLSTTCVKQFYLIENFEQTCFIFKFINFLTSFESLTSVLLVFVLYTFSFSNRNQLMEIQSTILSIDTALTPLDITIPYCKIQKLITIVTIVLPALDLILIAVSNLVGNIGLDSILTMLIELIPPVLLSFYNCWFISLMIVLKYRSKAMNEILIRNCQEYVVATVDQRVLNDHEIDIVMKMHEKMCDAVDMINSCFGFVVLCVLTHLFLYVIFLSYTAMKFAQLWIFDGQDNFMVGTVMVTYTLVIYTIRIMVLVLSTDLVLSEVNTTHNFVHKTINCFQIEKLQNKSLKMDHLDTISLLIKISQGIGLAPFYVYVNPQSQKKELYLSTRNLIVTILVFGIWLITTCWKQITYPTEPEFPCFLFQFLNCLMIYESWGSIVLVCIIYIVSFVKRPVLMEITTSILTIDSTLSTLNVDIPFALIKKRIIILTIGLPVLDLLIAFINLEYTLESIIIQVVELLPTLVISFYICWFISLLIVLKYRLRAMNEIIIRNCQDYVNSMENEQVINYTEIDIVMKMQEKICDAVDMINDCYGFTILIVLGYWFFYVIFMSYIAIRFATYSVFFGANEFYSTFLQMVYITSVYTLRCVILVLSSDLVLSQVSNTQSFVHKTINCFQIEKLQNKLTIFLMQLINRKPTFSACGLFEINLPLLFSMVGALFTYVIILIQFDQSDQGCIDKQVETKYNGTAEEHHENLTRAIYEILNDVRNNFTVAVHPAVTEAYDYVTVNVTDPALTTLSNITNATLNSLTQSNLTAPLADAFSALSELITQKIKNHSDPDSLRNITSDIRKLLSKN